MADIWRKQWWKATAERVISSVAGGALAALGSGAVGALEVDWYGVASMAAGAGIVSLLKALVAAKTGPTQGPGLTDAERISG